MESSESWLRMMSSWGSDAEAAEDTAVECASINLWGREGGIANGMEECMAAAAASDATACNAES